jgi:hypothetical protein
LPREVLVAALNINATVSGMASPGTGLSAPHSIGVLILRGGERLGRSPKTLYSSQGGRSSLVGSPLPSLAPIRI